MNIKKLIAGGIVAATLTSLLCVGSVSASEPSAGKVYTAKKLSEGQTITIDGRMDSVWNGVEASPIEHLDPDGAYSETTGTIRIAWDDKGYYVYVEVDKHGEPVVTACLGGEVESENGIRGNDDTVWLSFVNGGANLEWTHPGTQDYAFCGAVCCDADGNRNAVGWYGAYGNSMWKSAYRILAEDKYAIEYFIDWVRPNDTNVYGMLGVGNASIIKVEAIIYSQDSEGDTSFITWNQDDADWGNSGWFAYVQLTDEEPIEVDAYGNANSDGEVDVKDATLILKHLAEWEDLEMSESNADANDDGIIDLKDVTLILQYLAEWDVTLGPID